MWYYIKQDGLCVYASNQVKDVNDWLSMNGQLQMDIMIV